MSHQSAIFTVRRSWVGFLIKFPSLVPVSLSVWVCFLHFDKNTHTRPVLKQTNKQTQKPVCLFILIHFAGPSNFRGLRLGFRVKNWIKVKLGQRLRLGPHRDRNNKIPYPGFKSSPLKLSLGLRWEIDYYRTMNDLEIPMLFKNVFY